MSDKAHDALAELTALAQKVEELRSAYPEKSTKELIQMAVEELEKHRTAE